METPENDHPQRCEALMNQGYEYLDTEDFDEALAIAGELQQLQHTAGYEIAALAHEAQGNIEAAVEVLHRGVDAAPDCWPNWQLLGNCLSDVERFEEAEAAYEQALECKHVWESSVRLNQAILAGRQQRYDKALELLDAVDDPDLGLQVAESRVDYLHCAGKTAEAVQLAEETLASTLDYGEAEADALARIAALLGRMRMEAGEEKAEVRKFALQWLDVDPCCELLFKLIRDLDGLVAGDVRYYNLFLHAKFPPDHPLAAEAVGYYVSYAVVAENPEEALELARQFEDPDLAPLLEIEETEVDKEVEPTEPKGVWYRSAMHLYEKDE
jgi:tetratricopeptide (TPR) repeat protein